MALESAEKLKPFGKTIIDATDFYAKFLRDAERSISVSNLIEEKRSDTHISDLNQRLGRFKETFANQPMRTISTVEIEAWLHRPKLGVMTKKWQIGDQIWDDNRRQLRRHPEARRRAL
jgi:hypothetical protein